MNEIELTFVPHSRVARIALLCERIRIDVLVRFVLSSIAGQLQDSHYDRRHYTRFGAGCDVGWLSDRAVEKAIGDLAVYEELEKELKPFLQSESERLSNFLRSVPTE